jgi:glycosyltransferase involved in cell wall biosynthesis
VNSPKAVNFLSNTFLGPSMKSSNHNQAAVRGVSVAIATYNGAKYLRQQLESIAQQTILPNEIIISDDCSDDNTREIVESFVKSSAIPIRFLSNQRNVGIINNFFNAFNHCTGDYIFYCDQDDVWMPNKIEQCLQCFAHSSQIKLVIHQDNIVDEHLTNQNIIQPFMSQSHVMKSPIYRDDVWGFGHQMVFHRTILPILTYLKESNPANLSHVAACFDFSIIVAAGLCGDIYMLKKPLVLFRRHSDSTTNAGKLNENLVTKANNKKTLNSLYIAELEALLCLTDLQSFQNLLSFEGNILYKTMLRNKLLKYKKITLLYADKSLLAHLVIILNTISFGIRSNLSIKKEIAKNIFYASLLLFTKNDFS